MRAEDTRIGRLELLHDIYDVELVGCNISHRNSRQGTEKGEEKE